MTWITFSFFISICSSHSRIWMPFPTDGHTWSSSAWVDILRLPFDMPAVDTIFLFCCEWKACVDWNCSISTVATRSCWFKFFKNCLTCIRCVCMQCNTRAVWPHNWNWQLKKEERNFLISTFNSITAAPNMVDAAIGVKISDHIDVFDQWSVLSYLIDCFLINSSFKVLFVFWAQFGQRNVKISSQWIILI